jgi:hypothetical protein
LVIAFPVIPANRTINPRRKYIISIERVAVSTNILERIISPIPENICKIRVYPRERIFISSPPSTRGIAQRAIIAYARYFFVSSFTIIPKRELSIFRSCTQNAIIHVKIRSIQSDIFA